MLKPIDILRVQLAPRSARSTPRPAGCMDRRTWSLLSEDFTKAKTGRTSPSVATQAGKALGSSGSSAIQKTLAGSALAQSGTSKRTSATVASAAGKALESGRSSATTKDLAGSVLEQRKR